MSSYPKGGRHDNSRAARPNKRRFYGIQNEDDSNEPTEEGKSARKLFTAYSEDVRVKPMHFCRIIEFVSVFAAISEIAICKICKRTLNFEETGIRGIGFKIAMKCSCGVRVIDSGPLRNTGYEINHRVIFAMRLLGVGLQGLNLFLSIMDISKGLSINTYERVIQHIHEAAKTIFDAMCLRVVEEERKENEKKERLINNFTVSGDGSWKKGPLHPNTALQR